MELEQFKQRIDEFLSVGRQLEQRIQQLQQIPCNSRIAGFVKFDEALTTPLKNDITIWQRKAKEAITLYFGEGDYHTTEFIETIPSNWTGLNYKREFGRIVSNSVANVEAFATLLDETPNIKEKEESAKEATSPITINVHQSQTQSQNVAIEIFLEAIKDEIPGKYFKELKAIANEEPDSSKARSRILDKVKGFGEDVLSNIVANIITNPTIWSGLI